DNKDRLSKGLWFQGTENYAFVGLYTRSGGSNMTRSVGLIFKFADNGTLSLDLEFVWNGEQDERLIAFYHEAINKLGGFQQQTKTKYRKTLAKENAESFLGDFLNNEKHQLDELLRDNGLADIMFIKEEAFDEQLRQTINRQTALLQGAQLTGPSRDPKNETPLNQILYGPPGTGKTYRTVNKALSIIEGKLE